MGRRIQDIEQRLARHVNAAAAGEFRASEEICVQTGPLWAKGDHSMLCFCKSGLVCLGLASHVGHRLAPEVGVGQKTQHLLSGLSWGAELTLRFKLQKS